MWIELKYDRISRFYYYYGRITYNSLFYEAIGDVSIKFGRKYAQYGEWLKANMNMSIPL